MPLRDRFFGNKLPKEPDSVALSKRQTENPKLGKQWHRILVPACETPYSMRSLATAFRLAQGSEAIVKLAFVIEVPRALAMNAALPEADIIASQALEVAQDAARPYRINVDPFVHRTRNACEGIIKLIAQEEIDLLVLGERPDGLRGLTKDLTKSLFDRAQCEVVLDYIANEK